MSLESPKFELTKSRLDFYDGKPNKVDYDHQCFLARRLYDFLEPFDVYELEVDILGYKAEELFYGRPSIDKAFVDLDRDYFSTYHSLTHSWLIVIPSELINIFQKYAESDGFLLIGSMVRSRFSIPMKERMTNLYVLVIMAGIVYLV